MYRRLQSVSVAIAEGRHPVPYRTRKLSPPAPMVLPGKLGGRVGRRRDSSRSAAPSRRRFVVPGAPAIPRAFPPVPARCGPWRTTSRSRTARGPRRRPARGAGGRNPSNPAPAPRAVSRPEAASGRPADRRGGPDGPPPATGRRPTRAAAATRATRRDGRPVRRRPAADSARGAAATGPARRPGRAGGGGGAGGRRRCCPGRRWTSCGRRPDPMRWPDAARALADAVVALSEDGDPEAAVRAARAAKRAAPRAASVREALGIALYQVGDFRAARTELAAAQRISGRQDLAAMLADIERALGRPERAIALFERGRPSPRWNRTRPPSCCWWPPRPTATSASPPPGWP